MNTYSTLSGQRALKYIFAVCAMMFANTLQGQVAGYTCTSSSGTYSSISSVGTPLFNTMWDDTVTSTAINIGFNFVFNDVSYSTCRISSNGFLTFGTVAPGATNYNPISSSEGYSGTVSVLGANLQDKGAPLYTYTSGTSPNRVFTVEWKGRIFSSGKKKDTLNMQIRLYETSNNVELIYGHCVITSMTYYAQVGLRGCMNNDFNNRSGTNWASTVSGTTNTANVMLSTTVLPANGQIFTYSPPSCYAPSAVTASSIASTTVHISWTAPSAAPADGYYIYLSTSSTPPTVSTPPTDSVGAGVLAHDFLGLTPTTAYYIWVRSRCGAGSASSWSPPGSFATTVCNPSSAFPLSESFDGTTFSPSCWSNYAIVGSFVWDRQTSGTLPNCSPFSGTGMARFNSAVIGSGNSAVLVSPPVSFPDDWYYISFYFFRNAGSTKNDRMNIYFNSSPSVSGATLLGTVYRYTNLSAGWYNYTYNMPAGISGTGYIIFEAISDKGYNIFLDEVILDQRPVSSVQWTGNTSSTWATASNWYPSKTPTATINATVPVTTNQPVVSSTGNICNGLTIASGAVVTINPGGQLTVDSAITNNAGSAGLVISSTGSGTGSLLHYNDNVPMTIRRYISGADYVSGPGAVMYHNVSVPLTPSSTSLSALFMGSYLFWFNCTNDTWIANGVSTTTDLDETRGFMIFYPHSTDTTYTFTGNANNGSFTAYTTGAGSGNYCLVPNPYPSAIDWSASSGWTRTNLRNYFYIWNGVAGNYAVFGGDTTAGGVNGGTRYIPQGQSYFVKATGSSPVLSTTNAVRVHSTQNFWKSAKGSAPNLLRILAEANWYSDEIVVYFSNTGSEVEKFYGNDDAPQLYVFGQTELNCIQPLPEYTEPVTVRLGFEMLKDTTVTFTASGFESFDPGIYINLFDSLSGQYIDLRSNPVYTFNHLKSYAANRFQLIFGDTLMRIENESSSCHIYASDDHIVLSVPGASGKQAGIEFYDLSGRLLSITEKVLGEVTVLDKPDCTGVVMVRVVTVNKTYVAKLFL